MDVISFFKGFYYKAEDGWYNFLDEFDKRQIPIYSIIDPIDNVVPSFLLFILTSIFILVLIAYLIQFYSAVEFTFTAMDVTTKNPIEGVAISGSINKEPFSKVTSKLGEAKIVLNSKPINLFEKIGSLFFAEEDSFVGIISAEKSGYHKVEKKEYDLASKEVTIRLTKMVFSDANKTFTSSTDVELLDNLTNERIVDTKGRAFITYNCSNKGIEKKTSSDDHDGAIDGKFRLIEPNCNFVVKGAYAAGYEKLDTVNIELDPSQSLHAVKLSKINVPTKGTAKIYAYELNSQNVPLVNIQIRLLDLSGNSMIDGATDYSGIFEKEALPGTYLITATSPDGNYFALNSDANQLISVNVNETTSKTIYLKRMDPSMVRFVKLKVIDYNGKIPLKDVLIFPQQLVSNSDGNRDAKGMVGSCTNSCKTDSNGLITISGLSSLDTGKIVVSIFKTDYIVKFLEPTLFGVTSLEYQIVELEKADYSATGNSGKGTVFVRAKNDLRSLYPANTFMYFNSPELNIGGISLLQFGIMVDTNGKAIYTGLGKRIDKVYYAKAIYDTIEGKSLYKSVDVSENVLFDINIDTDISYAEVKLLGYNNFEVVDKNKAVVKITSLTSQNPVPEVLVYDSTTQTFKSKLHDKGRTYTLSIDLNNYVPILQEIELSLAGRNSFNQVMYPDNNDILVVFNGLYESANSQETANFLDLNNLLESDKKGYYAKLDLIVGKNLKDGNVLGTFRINDKMNITQAETTQRYFKLSEIYSCLAEEKTPYNDDNYYVQPASCVKNENALGKQLGVMWEGSVASGVYSINSRIEFTQNAKNGDKLDLNYSGKQNDYKFVSESRGNTNYVIGASMCKVSENNPSCPGILFYTQLNGANLGTERFDYNSIKKRFTKYNAKYEIEKDISNPLAIRLFNNRAVPIDFNLTVYSYSSPIDSFNNNTSGFFYFDAINGAQKKIIGTNIRITPFGKSDLIDVNVFTDKEKVGTYLIAVAELSNGEKYSLFLDGVSNGRSVYLLGGNFLSGVPDQIFYSNAINSSDLPVELDRVEYKTLRNCSSDSIVESGSGVVEGSSFSIQIPGVYEYEKDCLKLRVIAKDPIYRELNKTLKASTWGIEDPELSCLTLGVVDTQQNGEVYLQWGRTTNMVITNNCLENIQLQFESRLVLENSAACETLAPAEKCSVLIRAQNSDYVPAERFSDVLGVFPVSVKAKLVSSRKNFSQIKLAKIHIQNDKECFAISKDMFDLKKNPEQTQFVVDNRCQYTGFGDYFIPKADLKLSGVDLNEAKPKYGYIEFDYNITVSGGTYGLQTTQVLRENIWRNYTKFMDDADITSTANGDLKTYSKMVMEIPADLDAESAQLQFRWMDDSILDFYGAKIEGPVKVTYANGTTQNITPTTNFNYVNGFITGSGPGHWMIGDEVVPNGAVSTMKYGLFYVDYPKGKVKKIEFDVSGNPDPSSLLISVKVNTSYYEPQTVPVPNGGTTVNSISGGTFKIYPLEGMTFLLRDYSNPQVSSFVKSKGTLCKKVLTNNAWVGDGKVYYVDKHYNNQDGAKAYCTSLSNKLFDNTTNLLVPNFASIPSSLVSEWNSNLAQFSWMDLTDGAKGFWTDECTSTTCKAINKTSTEISASTVVNIDKYDIDSYVPLCVQDLPSGLTVTPASCSALGIICDAAAGTCTESTPELFDAFLSSGFITVINPMTEVKVSRVRTNDATLDNSAVLVWIEGGILKAMFIGKNYAGYDDGSIELNIINKDAIGDLYGTLNVVDYINGAN
jgi:hypothetical protein